MKIDRDLIEKVSRLARLNLEESEKVQLEDDFRDILDYFSKIDECDTSGFDEVLSPVKLEGVLRKDVAEDSLTQEDALSLSYHKTDGFFKGPRAV